MPFKRQKFIRRLDLQENPDTLYVFGDNMVGKGLGGQAKEMRGESNAVGIPTKRTPAHNKEALLKDEDLNDPKLMRTISDAFVKLHKHLKDGGEVVYPTDGIGTGLAQLEIVAPKVLNYINECVKYLEKHYG